MGIKIFLSVLYFVALLLPAIGIGKAFLRAKNAHMKAMDSDREEKRIREKYRSQLEDIRKRKESAREVRASRDMQVALEFEENKLKEVIRLEEEAHGVDRMTYERFNKALTDIVRNHPKQNYFLRVSEVYFVGIGIVFGTAASIWSLWI